MLVNKIKFKRHVDGRGQLIAIEEGADIPFAVKRVYYIFDTPGDVRRGFHAHKNLQQILICVSGSCKIHLDDGFEQAEVELNEPDEGLYVSSNIWREMYDFSGDAVLMCLASEKYDETDYIRNYNEFIKFIKENK